MHAAARTHFELADEQLVEVSNEWGFAVDALAEAPFGAALVMGHPGKLAKLIAGQWNTHSSQSDRAVGLVAQIARDLLPPPPESETVEGLFAGLGAADQKRLGDELARQIACAVAKRMNNGTDVAACLVNMTGEIIGSEGDLSPWQ